MNRPMLDRGSGKRAAASRRGRPRYHRPVQESLLSPWILLPITAVLGAFVASQFFTLTPRYIKLVFGLLAVLAVIRLPFASAVTLFVLVFPIPTFVFISDTNVLLIGLLLSVWVVGIALGRLPRPERSPVDWAIWIYLGVHAISFINVETAEALRGGVEVFIYLASGAVLYWLLYNAIRTEGELLRLLQAICLVSAFVDVTAVYEYFVGRPLVPEWFLHRAGQTISTAERIGGVFGFHGLLADFTAIAFYLQVFLGMRSRSRAAKVWYYGLAGVGLFVITATVNRGGALAWLLGGIYFLFLMRNRIDWVRVFVIAPVVVSLYALYQSFSSAETGRIRLIMRIAGTQIERGIPDTRVLAWTRIVRRIPDHLWIGHGPYYQLGGVGEEKIIYPHSAYLFYLYTTGVFGLFAWLWILVKLIVRSFPGFHVDFRRWSLAAATGALVHVQIVMFAAAQFRDEHQRGNVYLYFMWILFALAAISGRLVKESRREADGERSGAARRRPPREGAEGPGPLRA